MADFTNNGNVVQEFLYNSVDSISFRIYFELIRDDTPANDISLKFKLVSGEIVTPSVSFELLEVLGNHTFTFVVSGGLKLSGGTVSSYSVNNIFIDPIDGEAIVWSALCLLDNIDITETLINTISIEYEEDASTIAGFVIAPNTGVVDPLVYIGKSVELYWRAFDSNNNLVFSRRRFKGIVADVEWDADRRVINVTADSQLIAYFNNLTKEKIEEVVGGLWSSKVWDNENDATGWTHAQERLSTTENCVWMDENGIIQITNIKAKRSNGVITPDYEYTDNERFHETLKLEYAQRSEMTNNIRINLSYSYQRKRERRIYFSWDSHNKNFLSSYLCANYPGEGTYQLCQRSMIESAASSGDWVAISAITYDDIWLPQTVNCGGGVWDYIVWGYGVVTLFQPNSSDPTKYAYNASTGEKIYDRQVGYEVPTSPEVSKALCIGARWEAAKRWLQNVEEIYSIVVKAPDSIEAIGEVTVDEDYSLENTEEEDNTDWANSLSSNTCDNDNENNMSIMPGSKDLYMDIDEYAKNGTFNRDEFNLAQKVILSATTGDIVRSHRLNTVSFKVAYQPQLNLSHTVKVNTPYLVAEGKVKATKDTWDINSGEASTEIIVAISRHNGSGLYFDTDPLTEVEKPTPTVEPAIVNRWKLDNYIGGRVWGNVGFSGVYNSCDDEAEQREGFFTNFEWPMLRSEMAAYGDPSKANSYTDAMYKMYMEVANYTIPYKFVVRGPTIEEAYTDAVVVPATTAYNVAIPQDTLQLSA